MARKRRKTVRRGRASRCRIGGRKRSWRGLVKKYGVKRAAKMWRRAKRSGRCRRSRR